MAKLFGTKGIEELAHNIFNKWPFWYQLQLSHLLSTTSTTSYDPRLASLFHQSTVIFVWLFRQAFFTHIISSSFVASSSSLLISFRQRLLFSLLLWFWLNLIFKSLWNAIHISLLHLTFLASWLWIGGVQYIIDITNIAINLFLFLYHLWLFIVARCIRVLDKDLFISELLFKSNSCRLD